MGIPHVMDTLWLIILVVAFNINYCDGINLIDLSVSESNERSTTPQTGNTEEETTAVDTDTMKNDTRRYWLVSGTLDEPPPSKHDENKDNKDDDIKGKISTLVEQTLYDTQLKIKSLQSIKDFHREDAPYKAGFILSLIKKSKEVLNELFNVAIRHKDDWKALEQLKVFELIVHTNVDTTNLVRQLVEVHIQHMNATNTSDMKKRVVLLK